MEIGLNKNLKDEVIGATFDSCFGDSNTECITKENFFTSFLPKQFVESRSIALDAFREGIFLNGMFCLCSKSYKHFLGV